MKHCRFLYFALFLIKQSLTCQLNTSPWHCGECSLRNEGPKQMSLVRPKITLRSKHVFRFPGFPLYLLASTRPPICQDLIIHLLLFLLSLLLPS